jgi:hypothetical protein
MKENYIKYPEIEKLLKKTKFELGEADKVYLFNNIKESLRKKTVKNVTFSLHPLKIFAYASVFIVVISVFVILFNYTIGVFKKEVSFEVVAGKAFTSSKEIRLGDTLKSGSKIFTRENPLEIKYEGQYFVRIFENTEFNLISPKPDRIVFELISGKAFFDISRQEKYECIVVTPSLEIFIKGTSFYVEVKSFEETKVELIKGNLIIREKKNKETIELKEKEFLTYRGKFEKGVITNQDTSTNILEKKALSSPFKKSSVLSNNFEIQKGIENYSSGKFEDTSEIKKLIKLGEAEVKIVLDDGTLITRKEIIPQGINIINYTVAGDEIYIITENERLLAYSLNGNKLWENSVMGKVSYTSKPVVYQDFIYIATVDNGIKIFDKKGRLVNSINLEDSIVITPWILDKNSIIFVTEKGELVYLDIKNRIFRWKFDLKSSLFYPFVVDKNLLFITTPYKLYCITVDIGNILWQKEINQKLTSEPLMVYRDYLILIGIGEISIYTQNTGELYKTTNVSGNILRAVVEKEKLIIFTENEKMICYSLPDLVKIYEKTADEKINLYFK